jgi:hypothetical protein
VQAGNFTPGAISITLCVVSSRTSLTSAGSSGLTAASYESGPAENGPVCRSVLITAGGAPSFIRDGSYLSTAAELAGGPDGRSHAISESRTNAL